MQVADGVASAFLVVEVDERVLALFPCSRSGEGYLEVDLAVAVLSEGFFKLVRADVDIEVPYEKAHF